MNTLVHSEWRLLVEVELLCSQVYRRVSKRVQKYDSFVFKVNYYYAMKYIYRVFAGNRQKRN